MSRGCGEAVFKNRNSKRIMLVPDRSNDAHSVHVSSFWVRIYKKNPARPHVLVLSGHSKAQADRGMSPDRGRR